MPPPRFRAWLSQTRGTSFTGDIAVDAIEVKCAIAVAVTDTAELECAVAPDTVAGCGSIRAELNYNHISLSANTYTLTQAIGGASGWARDVCLVGAEPTGADGALGTILDAGGMHRHIRTVAGSAVILIKIRLINGRTSAPEVDYGGSIHIEDGAFTLEGCLLEGNAAATNNFPEGGAIFAKGAAAFLLILRTTIRNNLCGEPAYSDRWGAGGALAIGYGSGGSGGYPTVVMQSCTLSYNLAYWGAAIYVQGGKLSVYATLFLENVANHLTKPVAVFINAGTVVLGEGTPSCHLRRRVGLHAVDLPVPRACQTPQIKTEALARLPHQAIGHGVGILPVDVAHGRRRGMVVLLAWIAVSAGRANVVHAIGMRVSRGAARGLEVSVAVRRVMETGRARTSCWLRLRCRGCGRWRQRWRRRRWLKRRLKRRWRRRRWW